MKKFIYLLMGSLFFWACEKEIEVELPEATPKLVVEGTIEPGQPPIVILTRSQGYFEPTSINDVENLFVHNAQVTVTENGNVHTLTEICSQDLADSLLPLLAEIAGLDAGNLQAFNFCVYTSLDASSFGAYGNTYDLSITAEGKTVTSTTSILEPVTLDSVWFQTTTGSDSLGFAWATLSDPVGYGNAYRWYAKRINSYANGEQKDPNFYPPFSSVFNDEFIEGLTFDFAYDRGTANNSLKPDDLNEEYRYFKEGDTIVVKFCQIDFNAYEYISSIEEQAGSQGSPFASPSSIPTNIVGEAYGSWIGYSPTYDTIVAVPD